MYMYMVHILYAGVGHRPKRYPWMPLLPAMIQHLQKRSTYMYRRDGEESANCLRRGEPETVTLYKNGLIRRETEEMRNNCAMRNVQCNAKKLSKHT